MAAGGGEQSELIMRKLSRVAHLVLSQEDQPGTHRTVCHNDVKQKSRGRRCLTLCTKKPEINAVLETRIFCHRCLKISNYAVNNILSEILWFFHRYMRN